MFMAGQDMRAVAESQTSEERTAGPKPCQLMFGGNCRRETSLGGNSYTLEFSFVKILEKIPILDFTERWWQVHAMGKFSHYDFSQKMFGGWGIVWVGVYSRFPLGSCLAGKELLLGGGHACRAL